MTLIEVLVVILIVGTLISILVPLVMIAQEKSRQAQCVNNLKRIGLTCLNCESAVVHFPASGWGHNWIGDPDRGTGSHQPGGLIYNMTPYIECAPTYGLLYGKAYGTPTRMDTAETFCSIVYSALHCPSRRPVQAYPYTRKPEANNGTTSFWTMELFCDASGMSLLSVGKTDYAGNGGQHYFSADTLPGDKMCDSGGPVGSLAPPAETPYVLFDAAWKDNKPIEDGTGRWTLAPKAGMQKFADAADGIFYPFSVTKVSDIIDGASYTYLCGEKALCTDHATDGLDDGDNQCQFMGHDKNITRWAENPATGKATGPVRDAPSDKAVAGSSNLFGSPHPGGCNMAFCDGAVRTISFDIDPAVHANLANRKDGHAIPTSIVPAGLTSPFSK